MNAPLRTEALRQQALLALLRYLQDQGYDFITPTPATHARVLARPTPGRCGSDLRDAFGWNRPFPAALLPQALLQQLQAVGMVYGEGALRRSSVRVASLGENLLLHSAFPTEAEDAVFFGPDSYRFVAAIEAHLQQREAPLQRALDIGCGAGPGALCIARHAPQTEVLGVDINPAALELARLNAAFAGADHLQLCESDLFGALQGDFDLIVANPPYLLDPNQRTYRHGGGQLGLGLSLQIVEAALPRLSPGGSLLLYTGVAMRDGEDPLLSSLGPALQGNGACWRYREVDPDVFGEELEVPAYADVERIAAVVLEVRRAPQAPSLRL
ncbi:methyltransferase [Pseudomonas mangrovi]|uniref:SAM-dependent methyltransferase n=1 Tax=Pseudomonas mangrovi TaxID=2161748 RepID=A0A2T5PBY8_9PSED|nr:class I SAM-dependent methyltransferase [Pseudomonas mangrovi]PTU75256.1 SAM-dependent methyltransferase [Pseudomonas mangrovi]